MQRELRDVRACGNGGNKASRHEAGLQSQLQLSKADDNQKLRSLYYACKLYAGSLRKGKPYKTARRRTTTMRCGSENKGPVRRVSRKDEKKAGPKALRNPSRT